MWALQLDLKGASRAVSTVSERLLMVIGLGAAIASGVAIPMQTLLFGHLTTAFTSFAQALATGTGIDQAKSKLFSTVLAFFSSSLQARPPHRIETRSRAQGLGRSRPCVHRNRCASGISIVVVYSRVEA